MGETEAETNDMVREVRRDAVAHMIESQRAAFAALAEHLRMIHWQTLGSDADGTLKGMPVCGCCAWLDGIRKPWPCDTLKAVGVSS